MWVAALTGGIFERVVQYEMKEAEIKISVNSTYQIPRDVPIFASWIKNQMVIFNQRRGPLFQEYGWGEAKYFYGNNYVSICNKDERPIKKLWHLDYKRHTIWKPTLDSREDNTAGQIHNLDTRIHTVKDKQTLHKLLSLAETGNAQLQGNVCFFPKHVSSPTALKYYIENGVSLPLVGLNRYVELLYLNDYVYSFIVDNINGFSIATVDGNKLHFSEDNFLNFLRVTFAMHTADGKTHPPKVISSNPENYVIGNDVGLASSKHDILVRNSNSVLI
ncbi:hypothetical protein GcM3_010035 [Golovinomyces cichoracearum]|uniref:Uncharacterized protein n=1 Tax=Golovinomyces cichoracearum TaxID=62708 RepID=A0A420JA92_9PEZI|nr:hypothetical protein GcM3_010035 [Golovinomyces cichoracearum]